MSNFTKTNLQKIKYLIGTQLFVITSLKSKQIHHHTYMPKLTKYTFDGPVKLFFRRNYNNYIVDCKIKMKGNEGYGLRGDISLKHIETSEEMSFYFMNELREHSSYFAMYMNEIVEKIEIYGKKDNMADSNGKVHYIDFNNLLTITFESGSTLVLQGNDRQHNGTLLSYYSAIGKDDLDSFIQKKENEDGQKLFKLRYVLKY